MAVAKQAFVAAGLAFGPLLIAVAVASGVASAQAFVAATVTEPEIEQGLRLTRLASSREPSREDVIKDLFAQKRRLLTAQLAGIEVADTDVDAAYATIAKRGSLSPSQLTQTLAQHGIAASTLRQHIRADLAFSQYLRQKKRPEIPVWRE
jgi:peptidyl-prolyl cis-trans isomerase SurA